MSLTNPTPIFAPGSFLTCTSALEFAQYEGQEFTMLDAPTVTISGVTQQTSPQARTLRIVRNMSATAVLASQVVIPSEVSTFELKRTIGPQTAADTVSYVADPGIPGTGAPQYSLYFIVVQGPTTVLNAAGAADEGDIVVSTTTSGDAATIADGSVTAKQAANKIGRCISATVAGKMGVFVDPT
jgi:hypothetical protein